MSKHPLRVLLSEQQIRDRVKEIAARIDSDYPDGTLCLIGVLRGASIFLADLAREIRRPVRIGFVGVSSYGSGKTSSGTVELTRDIDLSVSGCDVVVVEDIVDTGITLTHLLRLIEQRTPRSLRVAALLDKPDRRETPVEIAYSGFSIPNEFVVGYGLDYAEDYRDLKDICILGELSGD